MAQSETDRLAAAHVHLMTDGARVTVRALKAAAGVSTDAAAAWLRRAEPAPEVPTPPNLTEPIRILWAAAWQAAHTEAALSVEDEVLGARARESEALERADAAEHNAAAAAQALTAAEARAAAAETRATTAEAALTAARDQASASDQNSRSLDTARTRAEAEADSLRVMLADLREDLRTTLRRGPS